MYDIDGILFVCLGKLGKNNEKICLNLEVGDYYVGVLFKGLVWILYDLNMIVIFFIIGGCCIIKFGIFDLVFDFLMVGGVLISSCNSEVIYIFDLV